MGFWECQEAHTLIQVYTGISLWCPFSPTVTHGTAWDITLSPSLYPSFHPVSLYHGTHGTSHSVSHSTLVSILSHFTMGHIGLHGTSPQSTPYPTIPSPQGDGRYTSQGSKCPWVTGTNCWDTQWGEHICPQGGAVNWNRSIPLSVSLGERLFLQWFSCLWLIPQQLLYCWLLQYNAACSSAIDHSGVSTILALRHSPEYALWHILVAWHNASTSAFLYSSLPIDNALFYKALLC